MLKKNATPNHTTMKNLLDKISPDEALKILKLLAETDKRIENKIFSIAENIITDIDIEDICDDVFWSLDAIDVHDLWNRSGSNIDGYISPVEMAFEMVEEDLEPFQQKIFRFIELGLHQKAKLFCMGVLKGLYTYEHNSKSEFKDWAADIPGESFRFLLDKWKKHSKNKSDIKEMNEFLIKECKKWLY